MVFCEERVMEMLEEQQQEKAPQVEEEEMPTSEHHPDLYSTAPRPK